MQSERCQDLIKDLRHGVRVSQLLSSLYNEAKNTNCDENSKMETTVSYLIAELSIHSANTGLELKESEMAQEQLRHIISVDINTFNLIFGGIVLHLQQANSKLPIILKYESSDENDTLCITLETEMIVQTNSCILSACKKLLERIQSAEINVDENKVVLRLPMSKTSIQEQEAQEQ